MLSSFITIINLHLGDIFQFTLLFQSATETNPDQMTHSHGPIQGVCVQFINWLWGKIVYVAK